MLSSSWHHPTLQKALVRTKNSQHLVLFVGAGASMTRGLPSWRALADELVRRCALALPAVKAEDRIKLGELMRAESNDVMAIVDFLEALLGENWVKDEIATLFYGNRAASHETSDLLNAIAYLVVVRHIFGLETTIITTNFDDLLEDEISTFNRGVKSKRGLLEFTPVYDEKTLRASRKSTQSIPIHHIHGFIGREGTRSNHLVLSLSDFAQDWNKSWSHKVLVAANTADVWLTIGMGLSDLHVLKYLFWRAQEIGSSKKRRTYALLPRQNHNFILEEGRVGFYLERAVRQGFRNLGVEPIFVNWYGELAIAIDEITVQTRIVTSSKNELYMPYDERLGLWWERAKDLLNPSSSKSFDEAQLTLTKKLNNIRKQVSRVLSGRYGVDETFKVEFWLCSPENPSHLLCVASSENKRRFGSTPPRVQLHPNSSWASVRAFQEGVVRASHADAVGSRWQSFCAWPVKIDPHPYEGILVGVLVFSSQEKLETSALVENPHIGDTLKEALSKFEKVLDFSGELRSS